MNFPSIGDHLPNINSNIKSIQKGVFSKTANLKTASITINSVDISKSIILFYAKKTGGTVTSSGAHVVNLQLSNSTTISASFTDRYGYGYDSTFNVYWVIIEFKKAKVQRGSIRPSSSGISNITINTVNINNAFAIGEVIDDTYSLEWSGHLKPYRIELTNSTTLIFESYAECLQVWQVIEF